MTQRALESDCFYPVCIIAPADQIVAARQGAWEFHHQDSPIFADTVEMMLTIALSPTGDGPATDFMCRRHDTLEALSRIETYQKALQAAGKPRVPVTLYIGKNALKAGEDLEKQLAAHEAVTLKSLGLRRIG